MSKSKSLATENKKKKTRTSKKMSCLDWLMALRLSPVYLHTLKWHWHWKCLCHCQWHKHRGRQALLPPHPRCHCHRRVYCIVLCSFESYSVVVYGPRQIERSPGVAAVSVSASHCRRMTSLPLPCLLSPYLLASPY